MEIITSDICLKVTNREIRPLVTDEPVEFEKSMVQVQDLDKLPTTFGGIYGIYLDITGKLPQGINM